MQVVDDRYDAFGSWAKSWRHVIFTRKVMVLSLENTFNSRLASERNFAKNPLSLQRFNSDLHTLSSLFEGRRAGLRPQI